MIGLDFELMAAAFGISVNLLMFIFAAVTMWDLAWRGVALWKSSRHKQKIWFVFLLVCNTIGILPIIYILFFQKKR